MIPDGNVNLHEEIKSTHKGDYVGKYKRYDRDFPGGAVVRNPPANAGDTGSSPGLGRSHLPQNY